MKKQRLLKTLLVAASLFTGVSAWGAVGDETTNLNIDFTNAITDGKVAGTVGSITIGGSNTVIVDASDYLSVGNGTSTAALTGSAAGSGDQVVVKFDLAFGKLSGKNVWFRLKDSSDDVIGEFEFCPYSGTVSKNTFGIATDDIYYASNTVIWERKVSFTITLDYKASKITTATTCLKSGAGKAATSAEHEVTMTNRQPLATFEIGSNYNNNGRLCAFSNLLVKTIEGESVAATSYTINYKLSDDVVKTVTSSSAVVGQVVTAETAIDGTETGFEGNHYLITAADAPTMTLVADAASNVLNVPVRAPYTATLNVTYNVAGVDESPISTVFTETDDKVCGWSYSYPLYFQKSSKYYIADVTGTYGESGVFTNGQTINKTVDYTDEVADVVFFEDAVGKTERFGASAGYTGIWGGDPSQTQIASFNLDAGIYEATFYIWAKAGSGSNHRGEQLDVNGVMAVDVAGNINGERKFTFEVASDASTIDIYGKGSNKATDEIDYILIKKLPSAASVTVSDAGMATYVNNDYDLDFSATEIKAYKAKVTAKGVCTLTEVANVPAGTPVLLVKDGGKTEDIPVMTGAAAVSDNDLVAGTGAAVATTDGEYTNMILNNIGGQVGFYFAAGQTVAANRAYLHFASTLAPDAVGSGSRMTMVFGDDMTTGINAVESAKTIDGIYNLAGQRVAQPTRGLYIMNGKKFVVK